MFKFTLRCIALVLALAAGSVHADIGKQQAARIAQEQFDGRVIAVSEDEYQARRAYRVKILSEQGDLHVVIIDLHNGDVLAAH